MPPGRCPCLKSPKGGKQILTETQMRKLKIIEHISLDGVIQVSGEDGDFPYGD